MTRRPDDVGNFIQLDEEQFGKLLVLKQKPIDAVPTPLPSWNHRCRDFGGGVGLARGWHITIGANTGNGKSILGLNIARGAVEYGESVAFISLEMSWEQLATRYMAIVSGEKINRLEPGNGLDAAAHNRAARAVQALRERTGGRIMTNERYISSLDDIVDSMRMLFEIHGCRVAIVDYMQLAKVVGVSSLLEGVTMISSEVRGTGADLGLVTVGLSQLNRETSRDRENPPTPQGLMGGSPLENDSDQVLLIDHTNYERNAMTNTATQKFILGKNRHGPCSPIDCLWEYDNLRVRELTPVYTTGPLAPPDRGEAYEDPELEADAA